MSHIARGPTRVVNVKITVSQFQVLPLKSDIEKNIVVLDYTMIDRSLKEERNSILWIIKKIKATSYNVPLTRRSILHDDLTDLLLHYLSKVEILVVKDVERDDIEFITKNLNCLLITNIQYFREEKLGHVDIVEEVMARDDRFVKITGIKNMGYTTIVLVTESNLLVLDEVGWSLHDSLCVIRCLVNMYIRIIVT